MFSPVGRLEKAQNEKADNFTKIMVPQCPRRTVLSRVSANLDKNWYSENSLLCNQSNIFSNFMEKNLKLSKIIPTLSGRLSEGISKLRFTCPEERLTFWGFFMKDSL